MLAGGQSGHLTELGISSWEDFGRENRTPAGCISSRETAVRPRLALGTGCDAEEHCTAIVLVRLLGWRSGVRTASVLASKPSKKSEDTCGTQRSDDRLR